MNLYNFNIKHFLLYNIYPKMSFDEQLDIVNKN